MTNYINNTPVNSLYARSVGGTTNQPFVDVFLPRDPDVTDTQYLVQQKWLNTADNAYWVLEGFNSAGGNVVPIWIKFGSEGLTETLTGNTGGAVPATLNNINVLGDGVYITTVGTPLTSTLTIEPAGGIATLYTENTGTASAMAGNLNVLGGTGITTVGSGNTITISTTGVATTGFTVDAHTAPGTNPVVPTSSGIVTVTGGQVAAGTTANVIETNSLAANTYTIDIQRSQAVASSTVGDNGVSHYNSADFSVDANGFVSLATAFYQTGTFVPTLAFGGSSTGIAYSLQEAEYTKIGNVVYVVGTIDLTNVGSATGVATIQTLPFSASMYGSNFFLNATALTVPTATLQLLGELNSGNNYLILISTSGSPTVGTQFTNTAFANDTTLLFQGFYFTS